MAKVSQGKSKYNRVRTVILTAFLYVLSVLHGSFRFIVSLIIGKLRRILSGWTEDEQSAMGTW